MGNSAGIKRTDKKKNYLYSETFLWIRLWQKKGW
jgi:hypothetical protein